ncbi:uncharacterized protein MONBRDRAFT_22657 [Monosiga brevicollis MX1]|uniref:Ras-GEF domain-containing protein n=1 Tax=Monosiga brevicollis TaxID=81824 RepID=A9URN7_MONBE|nr:uncharacterized protein MONBRDRAFT_22657 [Monosiga brevicollis MX1]EDQ91639.1 predicted protein [Monosiga brevicollis MX1]|eukprot:XP_001742925.1 hypothetical protein [Monosiga brevicollis MX1]
MEELGCLCVLDVNVCESERMGHQHRLTAAPKRLAGLQADEAKRSERQDSELDTSHYVDMEAAYQPDEAQAQGDHDPSMSETDGEIGGLGEDTFDSDESQYVDMEGSYCPPEVVYFEAERDQQPVLKAATLTQWALLTHLVERFEAHLPRPDMSGDEQKVASCVRSRVLYNGDFFQDVTLEDRLRRFMQNQEAHMDPQQRDAVLKLLAQRVENLASVELRRPSRARPSVSRNVARTLAAQSYHDISLTDLKPMAIAEQLTLWMWRSYARVRPTELLMKERGERTPHINSMTIKTEKVTHWALGMVLMTRDPTQRMRNYKFLIRLADALLQLGNFELAKGVAVAVDHTLVVQVIDEVKYSPVQPKMSKALSSIQKIAIDKGPHLLERLQNRHCEQLPCIPPLFVYMRNRAICEEKANAKRPEYMPEGMLFVHKYRMICEHVRDALKFQRYEYVIETKNSIQEYLDTRLMPNMTSELAESKFEEWNRLSYELVPSKRGSKAISGSIDETASA